MENERKILCVTRFGLITAERLACTSCLEKEKTLMPVQISNYLIRPYWNSTENEYKINTTAIEWLKPSHYNFQYTPGNEPAIVSLIGLEDNVKHVSKVRIKCTFKKGKTVEKTKTNNLNMLKSAIRDGTATYFPLSGKTK